MYRCFTSCAWSFWSIAYLTHMCHPLFICRWEKCQSNSFFTTVTTYTSSTHQKQHKFPNHVLLYINWTSLVLFLFYPTSLPAESSWKSVIGPWQKEKEKKEEGGFWLRPWHSNHWLSLIENLLQLLAFFAKLVRGMLKKHNPAWSTKSTSLYYII